VETQVRAVAADGKHTTFVNNEIDDVSFLDIKKAFSVSSRHIRHRSVSFLSCGSINLLQIATSYHNKQH